MASSAAKAMMVTALLALITLQALMVMMQVGGQSKLRLRHLGLVRRVPASRKRGGLAACIRVSNRRFWRAP